MGRTKPTLNAAHAKRLSTAQINVTIKTGPHTQSHLNVIKKLKKKIGSTKIELVLRIKSENCVKVTVKKVKQMIEVMS